MNPQYLESILNIRITSVRPLHGGEISGATLLTASDGAQLVAKQNANAPAGMFAAEADGLARIGESRQIRVPHVLRVIDGEDIPSSERLIAMEYVPEDGNAAHSAEFGENSARRWRGCINRRLRRTGGTDWNETTSWGAVRSRTVGERVGRSSTATGGSLQRWNERVPS